MSKFFTAHEREELKGQWGSRSTRLTRDSFIPFGSCQLCLLPARDPVSCSSHGHLFCRECAVHNLLAQNKELQRLKREVERRKLEDEEEKEIDSAVAQTKALEEFERVQAGLSAKIGRGKIVGRQNGKITVEQDIEGGAKGVKRKLELDEDTLMKLGASQTAKKVKSDNDDLPSFWTPGKMPDHHKSVLKAIKPQATCPAATEDQTHDFSLKTLIAVQFTESTSTPESSTTVRICPSCDKGLSNSTRATVAKPCGHVLCKPCSDKFQRSVEKSAHDAEHDETVRCYVCQGDITPGRSVKGKKGEDGEEISLKKKKKKGGEMERGLVDLDCDGTGFAGNTKGNMVKKSGVVFQC